MPLAKRFYSLIAKINSVVVITLSAVTLFGRKQIVAMFTMEPRVQEMGEGLFILVAIMKFVDYYQTYLQGPIRAMGLQKMASYYAIACYWVIAVPLSAILGIW